MGSRLTKSILYLFNIAVLIASVCLFGYSLTDKKVMTDLFAYLSYYLILILMIVWAVQTVLFLRALEFSLRLVLKRYWPGILMAFILTIFVFASVEVGFKTLSDETNLLSVSGSMVNNKTCYNVTMGKYYYGNLNAINREIPKRPLVFPFMVNLLHTFTGFRHQNAFALNFIVMFLFLSGMYIAVRKFSGVPSSIAAMFLILSYPVITVFGTSGGFDLLNSVFFVMIMAAVYCYLKTPSSVGFSFIFSSLLVFGNIRYESMAFLFFLPFLLLVLQKIKWQYLKDCSYLFFITPLVNLPYIWQRILKHGAYQNPEDVAVYSFNSLVKNLAIFFKNLVDMDYYLPYAGFLSIISILILTYLIVEFVRKKLELQSFERYFLVVLVMSVLVNALSYLAHFFGVYTHPSSARFFITLSIVFALSPVALRVFKPGFISGTGLLVVAVIFFSFYHPIAVEGRFINALTGNRRTAHEIEFISKLDDKNILVITQRPGQFTALGYGAINFAYANKNPDHVLKEAARHLYSRAIVFQEVEYETQKPTRGTALPSDFKLNTLYEIQITATEFLRISELVISPGQIE